MLRPLVDLFGWLYVLVAAGGAVLSILHLGRSRWAALLLVGFGAETVIGLFYRLSSMMGTSFASSSAGSTYLLTSLLGLGARVAIVAAVAGLLSDLRGTRASVAPKETEASHHPEE